MNSILHYIGRTIKKSLPNWKLRGRHQNIEVNPKEHIDSVYLYAFGHTANWEKAHDINEVIQW